MKSLITFCLSLFVCLSVHAQVTIYSQTFEVSYTDWTLNTSDLGGVTTSTPNFWNINNTYPGNPPLIINTPDQPTGTSGITGAPNSTYMHISSAVGPANCTFNASGTHSYFAAMNAPQSTIGYTGVTLSFWWLCRGNATAFGEVFYRTSAGGAWTQISTMSTPPAAVDSYNFATTWVQATGIHVNDFDNQAFLEFGFRFKHGASGQDPAFGVDDILLTGTTSAVPVSSFTTSSNTACQDSCIIATSTTTGTPDSVRWSATGGTIATPTNTVTSICFPTAGTYTVTLTAYGGGSSTTSTNVIGVTPTPNPVIANNAGTHTLSVTGAYTSYQWASGTPIPSAIAGATNSTFTYSVSGTYYVGVDSAGCPGYSTVPFVYTTSGVSNINTADNKYWIAGSGKNAINLYASRPLDEALTVNIYDATGRSIVSDTWTSGNTTKQIDNTFFAPGLYIIRLSNKNSATVLRFIR